MDEGGAPSGESEKLYPDRRPDVNPETRMIP